jgi:hypothetical protein
MTSAAADRLDSRAESSPVLKAKNIRVMEWSGNQRKYRLSKVIHRLPAAPATLAGRPKVRAAN